MWLLTFRFTWTLCFYFPSEGDYLTGLRLEGGPTADNRYQPCVCFGGLYYSLTRQLSQYLNLLRLLGHAPSCPCRLWRSGCWDRHCPVHGPNIDKITQLDHVGCLKESFGKGFNGLNSGVSAGRETGENLVQTPVSSSDFNGDTKAVVGVVWSRNCTTVSNMTGKVS